MARRTGLDLLFGEKIPGVKFPTVGTEVEGVILKIDSRQRKAYDPKKPGRQGEPMWWQDGSPVALSKETARRMDLTEEDMVLDPVVVLQTAEKIGRGDDGRRRLFCNSQLMREALRASTVDLEEGAKWELGGRLRVKHTGMGEAKEEGGREPKDYEAEYTPPKPDDVPPPDKPANDDPWK